ncbi:dephospho-CoA kinase [Vibrio nigripulchritudo MADA3029]|uniref:dephospho-CoA kinase n=1 Tax=Vibrio nigripulchritudo TaxID=28173 RepID=UPI0003B1E301|nr:dephospho-CoA kinase [Vibrio nigripulchritudo]CCN46909.1 dephospho-CoA kinase [Vibrio nigripulchritudo MADA3020]CCN51674.1 dephospho-CoA kinase [Vibrio nigripulchritudo MADA3021]CCN57280.1 dephospho-CoA kinase [Vibrio nigripulchritudo MADA3029]
MTFVVGLTGGIASGKTTVANLFQEHFGIEIVDADVIAREVVEPGSEGLSKIVEHFGSDILSTDGSLDRSQLRSRIFENENEKLWLNDLLHPMIRQKMKQNLALIQSPYALLVVPLLVENNLQSMANTVLVVDVERDTQISRTMNRDGVSKAQVESILNSQASHDERLAHADHVVDNNQSDADLLSQVTQLHQQFMSLSGQA